MEDTAAAPLPSLPKRLVQVFFSPGELFTALREKPVWFGALAVAAVFIVLSTILIPTDVWVEFSRNQMIQQGQEIPAGFESSGAIIRIFSVLGGPIGFSIMVFIIAGIVTLFFSFLFGDEGRYVQYLSVVAHAIHHLGPWGPSAGAPEAGPGRSLGDAEPGDLRLLPGGGVLLPGLEDGGPFRHLVLRGHGGGRHEDRSSPIFGFALTFFMAFTVAMALVFGIFGG